MTNDWQSYHGFVQFVDFDKFLHGTNFVGGAFEDLYDSAKICQVATTHPHLWNVSDDRKFFLKNNFFASAERPSLKGAKIEHYHRQFVHKVLRQVFKLSLIVFVNDAFTSDFSRNLNKKIIFLSFESLQLYALLVLFKSSLSFFLFPDLIVKYPGDQSFFSNFK